MKKKGVSGVITTLIIILLVLVAIGILWVIVNNLIVKGVGHIWLGSFFVKLSIQNIKVNNNGDLFLTLKRNVGSGEIVGVEFIISDGINSIIVKRTTNIKEIGLEIFKINSSEISNIGFIEKISIAPIYKTPSGEEELGGKTDSYNLNGIDSLKSHFGLISWWRFEGNVDDEISGHFGSIKNGADCNVGGKFGKSCKFEGAVTSKYIEIPSSDDFLIDNGTIILWFKSDDLSLTQGIFSKDAINYGTGGHLTIYIENSKLKVRLRNIFNDFFIEMPYSLERNKWYFVALKFGDGGMNLYLDNYPPIINLSYSGGIGNKEPIAIGASTRNSGDLLVVPLDSFFNGKIDDIIIFNVSLNNNEINQLKNLNLNN